MPSKVYVDAALALEGAVFDGMTLMSGGFGLSGNAENLLEALKPQQMVCAKRLRVRYKLLFFIILVN